MNLDHNNTSEYATINGNNDSVIYNDKLINQLYNIQLYLSPIKQYSLILLGKNNVYYLDDKSRFITIYCHAYFLLIFALFSLTDII